MANFDKYMYTHFLFFQYCNNKFLPAAELLKDKPKTNKTKLKHNNMFLSIVFLKHSNFT